MVPPARNDDKFWTLKFIVYLAITSLISYWVCRLVRLSSPSDMFYLPPIDNFFTLFIPALTGIVVNFLCFDSTITNEKKMELIPRVPRVRRFLISVGASLLTILSALFFLFKANSNANLNIYGFILPSIVFVVGPALLVGGFSSVLYGRNILIQLLIIVFSLALTTLILLLLRFNIGVSIIYVGFSGIIFAVIIDQWMNLYSSRLMHFKISRFHFTLSFIFTIFAGIAVAILSVKKA
jgi:hypothetical protein